MITIRSTAILLLLVVFTAGTAFGLTQESFDVKSPKNQEINKKCITCHLKENKSLVFQWENSPHAAAKEGQVGCYNCHAAEKGDEMGYMHEGAFIKAILTPNDCGKCHEPEAKQMSVSHHATAGEIMASLDNMLGEVIAGMPNNKGDMVNGCWQCHGSIVTLKRDKDGKPLRSKTDAPQLEHNTYPNSGIGRIIRMDPKELVMPVIPGTLSGQVWPDSPTIAANAISDRIIPKRRSTKSPSTASTLPPPCGVRVATA
jgi:hypothetical protein